MLHKKIIITVLSFFIIGFELITAEQLAQTDLQIEDVALEGLFGEDDISMPDIDLNALRSFEETFEPADIPLSEKLEMLMLIMKLKTRSYHNNFLEHLSQHGNEYLVGSACVASMLIAALLKNYISNTTAIPDASR